MRPNRSTAFASCLARGARALGRGAAAEAVEWFRAATVRRPERPEGFLNLAAALRRADRPAEAVSAARAAAARAPGSVEARLNLGNALAAIGDAGAAIDELTAATTLRPDGSQAWCSLGAARLSRAQPGDAEGAAADLLRAAALSPEWFLPRFNLGLARTRQGRDGEAIDAFREAIARRPDFAGAHLELAYLLLRHGRFAEGWRELEWRWHGRQLVDRHRPQPVWDGRPALARTLLVRCERGLGDLLHFVRFVRPARRLVRRVLVECPGSLRSLVATCAAVDGVIDPAEPCPGADLQVPMMSLPGRLRLAGDDAAAGGPYLSPPGGAPAAGPLPRRRTFRIGVAWTGSPDHPQQRHRSCAPSDFEPLARLPEVELLSLQHRDAGIDEGELRRCGIRSLGELGDFASTAAIARDLDLVVTVDTSVAHLAGALGRPVFLLLHDHPDWRWMTHPTRTIWYPTVRLFRQRRSGDWSAVMERVAAAVSALRAASSAERALADPRLS